MAFYLACCIAALLLGLAIMQTGHVWLFFRFLGTTSDLSEPLSGRTLPTVAVVLCLRGADPSLQKCLSGIETQAYPGFKLHLVVDNANDPALNIVDKFFDGRSKPTVHVIAKPFDSCSLKCSALLTAIEKIPTEIEVFALIDADAAPDRNWLYDLVAPLNEPAVGATTGNRWFAPAHANLGSYLRQIWNAAAVVQMDVYNIGWGGALAIKRSTISKCRLADKWRQAFCEDTMLSEVLQQHQLRLLRVPNLISENSESTSLSDAFWWIVRQLVTVRLYHPKWIWVKLHGLATAVGSVVAPVAMLVLFFLGETKAFSILAGAFAASQLWNLVLLSLVVRAHQRISRSRSGSDQSNSLSTWPLYLLAFALSQYVHPLSCLVADLVRRIRWRGIVYQISVTKQIQLVQYSPFAQIAGAIEKSPLQSID